MCVFGAGAGMCMCELYMCKCFLVKWRCACALCIYRCAYVQVYVGLYKYRYM